MAKRREENKIVCLHQFNSRLEAEVAKSALQAHNIDALIQANDEALRPAHWIHQTLGPGVRLLIHKEQVKKAKELLKL